MLLIDQILINNCTDKRLVEFVKSLFEGINRDPIQFIYDNFNSIRGLNQDDINQRGMIQTNLENNNHINNNSNNNSNNNNSNLTN